MEKLEALKKARDLITDPEHWCINCFAKDKKGNPSRPNLPESVRFCAIGAVLKVCTVTTEEEALSKYGWGPREELAPAANRLGYANPADLNNIEGHTKTLEMFDLAICMEECKAEELENA